MPRSCRRWLRLNCGALALRRGTIGRQRRRRSADSRGFEHHRRGERLFGLGELGKGSEVPHQHSLSPDTDDSQRLPTAQKAAYGEERCAGQLRQFSARETDFQMAVGNTSQPVRKTQEFAAEARAYLLGGDFTKTLLHLLQAFLKSANGVAAKRGEALQKSLESCGIPDECCGRLNRCGCRTMSAACTEPKSTYNFAHAIQPEYHFVSAESDLGDLDTAGKQHNDLLNRVALGEDSLAAREAFFTGSRSDAGALGRGHVREQCKSLDYRGLLT